jgi:SAM-dependent methyltransferase
VNWSERLAAYKESPGHRAGRDLDTLIEWCDPGPGVTALDVATGGGHVADRLRAEGCEVTTCDAAEGMHPDVVCSAEALPFADETFDVVACRIAAHHFTDVAQAVREMARVTRRLVVIEDTLYTDPEVERAERLRDPTHVRNHSHDEWLQLVAGAGLDVIEHTVVEKHHPLEAWLARTGCTGGTAQQVRELVAHRTLEGAWIDRKIVLRASRE